MSDYSGNDSEEFGALVFGAGIAAGLSLSLGAAVLALLVLLAGCQKETATAITIPPGAPVLTITAPEDACVSPITNVDQITLGQGNKPLAYAVPTPLYVGPDLPTPCEHRAISVPAVCPPCDCWTCLTCGHENRGSHAR